MLGIEETARRLGHHRWLARRLFEVLGGWVPATPEPPAKVLLAAHAGHQADHAERWARHLPRIAGLGVDERTRPGHEALVDALAALEALAGTVERVAVAHRVVLTAQLADVRAQGAVVSAVADPALLRLTALVAADLERDLEAAERLLAALGGPDATAVAAATDRVAAALAAAGGVAGPLTPLT